MLVPGSLTFFLEMVYVLRIHLAACAQRDSGVASEGKDTPRELSQVSGEVLPCSTVLQEQPLETGPDAFLYMRSKSGFPAESQEKVQDGLLSPLWKGRCAALPAPL